MRWRTTCAPCRAAGDELDALAAFKASKRELTSNVGLEPSEIVDPRHRRGCLGPRPLEPDPLEPHPLEPHAVERRHRLPQPELGGRELRLRLRRRRCRDRRGRSRPDPVEPHTLEPDALEPHPLVQSLVLLIAGPLRG